VTRWSHAIISEITQRGHLHRWCCGVWMHRKKANKTACYDTTILETYIVPYRLKSNITCMKGADWLSNTKQQIFLGNDGVFLRKLSNTIRVWKRRVLCNTKYDYVFLGHVTSVISGPTIFDFPTPIFNHFHNKIVCAAKHTHHTNFTHSTLKELYF